MKGGASTFHVLFAQCRRQDCIDDEESVTTQCNCRVKFKQPHINPSALGNCDGRADASIAIEVSTEENPPLTPVINVYVH